MYVFRRKKLHYGDGAWNPKRIPTSPRREKGLPGELEGPAHVYTCYRLARTDLELVSFLESSAIPLWSWSSWRGFWKIAQFRQCQGKNLVQTSLGSEAGLQGSNRCCMSVTRAMDGLSAVNVWGHLIPTALALDRIISRARFTDTRPVQLLVPHSEGLSTWFNIPPNHWFEILCCF